MSDIDYPQLLDYYKIAYAMPNLISYHNARLSQYFVNNRITKLKSIDLLGQTYIGNNSSGKRGSLVQAFFRSSNGRTSSLYTRQIQDEGIAICLPEFSADNYHNILRVHRIHLEVAIAVDVTDMNEERMLIIPMPKKYYA
ncbi:hypothetical protein PHYBLDRAFT_142399 [Phycomyces blakesleeanus NRRL 1555(-)]|uniref:Uncharacterized protein n=1 Tax=Phycomyces blakesleeanus (strain ATCC 8743b / DSM 1359 / FGSC 10004 / NBRC 33097 / NRRL 1555) TaxID=763407 RepID=A0A167NYQ3_PHYB8|nr:hypothetical protein PHYBLDRAFT_142399 [Phycomyces blakesleeanus NRRL 1555(-)]OAD76894.1 hypothetical protein PHYBLDRAFT_142399 [Phycomyces blakesleeanus NRRL 1555(-)]|eukprot:XP_018294934.1 hypothetical protein PHYBLDRAFT_142399 [Phycomyces blakesleeanus NRRL 1555(-)]